MSVENLPWAVQGREGLRVRVAQGQGRAVLAVALHTLRQCVVGGAPDCDIIIRSEDVEPHHLILACDTQGEVYVVPLQKLSLLSHNDTTPAPLEPNRPTALPSDSLILFGSGFTSISVTSRPEENGEVVHSAETWKNTMLNAVATGEAEIARFHKDFKWQKTTRWTGQLVSKRLTFATKLEEYEGAASTLSLASPSLENSPEVEGRVEEGVGGGGGAEADPHPKRRRIECADGVGIGVATESALPAPPPRVRRNLCVVHPGIPPPPPAMSPLVLNAFPALIVECSSE